MHLMSLYVGLWCDEVPLPAAPLPGPVAIDEYVSAYEPCVLPECMRSSNEFLSPVEFCFKDFLLKN